VSGVPKPLALSLKANIILLSCAGYRKGAPAPVLGATELSRLINSLGIRCPPYPPFQSSTIALTLHGLLGATHVIIKLRGFAR
jgi:hypothetical protein